MTDLDVCVTTGGDDGDDYHEKMCKCGKNPADSEHTCPFRSDVYNDNETMCSCCSDCRHECAMDI